jgi:hypothetical protein
MISDRCMYLKGASSSLSASRFSYGGVLVLLLAPLIGVATHLA